MFAVFRSRGPAKGRLPEPQPSADPAESFSSICNFTKAADKINQKVKGNQIRDLHAVSFPGSAGRGGCRETRREAGKILPGRREDFDGAWTGAVFSDRMKPPEGVAGTAGQDRQERTAHDRNRSGQETRVPARRGAKRFFLRGNEQQHHQDPRPAGPGILLCFGRSARRRSAGPEILLRWNEKDRPSVPRGGSGGKRPIWTKTRTLRNNKQIIVHF